MSTKRPARAGIAVVAVVVVWVAWWRLVRLVPVQGDDFTSAVLSGTPDARFTLQAWWHQAVHDWWSATGRQSGTLFRVFQRMGERPTRLAAAGVEALLVAVVARWILPREGRIARAAMGLLALGAVPAIAHLAPAVNGDAVFWMLASFDYVAAPMLAMAAGLLLVRIAEARSITPHWRLGLPLLVLAPLLHECSSLALLAVVLATAVLRGRGTLREERVQLGAAGLGCVLQLTSPGIYARLGALTTQQGEDGMVLHLHRWASFFAMLARYGRVEFGVVLVVLVVTCWAAGTGLLARVAGAAACACGLGTLRVADHFTARRLVSASHRLVGGERLLAGLLVVLGAATLALLLTCTVAGVRQLGPRVLVATCGLGGSLAPTLLTGVVGPRAYLPVLLWSVVLAGCLVRACCGSSHRRPGEVMAVLLGLAALASTMAWYVDSEDGLEANHRTHQVVLAQIRQVRASGAGTVIFPAAYPAPAYLYTHAFLLSRYGGYLHTYYGLGASVVLTRQP